MGAFCRTEDEKLAVAHQPTLSRCACHRPDQASLQVFDQFKHASSRHGIGSSRHQTGSRLGAAGMGWEAAGMGLEAAGLGLEAAGMGLGAAGMGLGAAGRGLETAGMGLEAAVIAAGGCNANYACCAMSTKQAVLLSRPLELLDAADNRFAIQLDVLDDVLLVLQVQVAKQGCYGALGRHCHAQCVVALWVRWVKLLHHIVRLPITVPPLIDQSQLWDLARLNTFLKGAKPSYVCMG